MRHLYIIFILFSHQIIGQGIVKPTDLRTENILIELNDFDETVLLMNKEYERANDSVKCLARRQEILNTTKPHNRFEFGDNYAVAIEGNLVEWLNELIVKTTSKIKNAEFTILTNVNKDNYPPNEWRYSLKSKYIQLNGDPLETRLIFYFFDRQENQDLLDYNKISELKTFMPFVFYTADKIYPFYGMIKSYRVKGELEIFFSEF